MQGFAVLIVIGMHERGTADFGEFHCLLLLRLQVATDLERRQTHDTAISRSELGETLLGGYLREAIYSVLGMFHFCKAIEFCRGQSFIVWVKENVAVKHGTVGLLELSADQCM